VSKPKTIFNILGDLTFKKVNSDTYTDSDWKAYNTYMVNRWLSMNSGVTEIINFVQKYYSLDKKVHFKMLSDILPKQKLFSKYVKGKKVNKFNPELVNMVAHHYEISRKEAKERIEMYIHFSTGVETLTDMLRSYGKTDKEIKKLLK
jgi:hypothetical protein|tara:strand:- start:305 stop:745 length:441 start_codon:yes stop_codon:yes gene_type:complete